MRLFGSPLFLTALTLLSACTVAVLPGTHDGYPSLPFNLPQLSHQSQDNRWLWSRYCSQFWHRVLGGQKSGRGRDTFTQPVSYDNGLPSKFLTRYGGDVVLRFHTATAEELNALAEASKILFLDVWEFTDEWVDIRLAKDVVPSLLGLLPASLQTAHTLLMYDLAQRIFESYPSGAVTHQSATPNDNNRAFTPSLRTSALTTDETNIFFQDYRPLSVMVPWMRLLSSLFPTHVRMVNIGISYEGRDIPALRVGVHPTNSEHPSAPRKTIIISGGSHAREWISTSTVNYVAYSLITSYGKSQAMTKLLEGFDWVFIPTLNPDGYVYTWESDRLWRKNRQQTNLRFCRGVDLDRSFGFEWDGEITSSNPCSESFAGDGPFEGIESRRFADWAKNETENNNVDFVGYLDLHSYSQQVLYPYSYSCVRTPPSLENLEELAMGLAKAIRLTNGEFYGVSSACEGTANKNQNQIFPKMETGGGSALDWFYHELHVRHAFQIKLRDKGSYGFLLPSKNIIPTGKEIFNAAVAFGRFLLGNRGIELDWESEFKRGTISTASKSSTGPTSDAEANTSTVMGVRVETDFVDEQPDQDDDAYSTQWELRRRRRR